MKISTRKDIIESILINSQAFLDRKDPTNITSHILIDASNDSVTIKATDTEIGLEVNSDMFNIQEAGITTVNGKKLLDFIRALENDNIEIYTEDNNLILKQNKTIYKLPTFNYEEYPTFPTIESKAKISLDSLELIKSLKKIAPAIDSNNPKHQLNGALIDIKSDITNFVGTDTKRLAVVSLNKSSDSELSLIIPKKAIIEIQKLFLDQIDIFYDETYLIIKNEQFFFYSRLINGSFPDYERIIPKSIKYSFNIPKDKFLKSIKKITVASQEIQIKLQKDSITLKSYSSDIQSGVTTIETPIDIDEEFEFAVNSKFLLDFISQIDSNEFLLELNEPTLPFVVKSDNFLTVIMPIY